MAEHAQATPRPWEIRPTYGLPDEDWWSIVGTGAEIEAAEVCIMPRQGERNAADARLIVQAVNQYENLLAACQEALAVFRRIRDTTTDDVYNAVLSPEMAVAWDHLKDAIAAATKEAPDAAD